MLYVFFRVKLEMLLVAFCCLWGAWSVCYACCDEQMKNVLSYGNQKSISVYEEALTARNAYNDNKDDSKLVEALLSFLELSLSTYDSKAIHNLASIFYAKGEKKYAQLTYRESAELGQAESENNFNRISLQGIENYIVTRGKEYEYYTIEDVKYTFFILGMAAAHYENDTVLYERYETPIHIGFDIAFLRGVVSDDMKRGIAESNQLI